MILLAKENHWLVDRYGRVQVVGFSETRSLYGYSKEIDVKYKLEDTVLSTKGIGKITGIYYYRSALWYVAENPDNGVREDFHESEILCRWCPCAK